MTGLGFVPVVLILLAALALAAWFTKALFPSASAAAGRDRERTDESGDRARLRSGG